jgi:hypothetical protein
LSCFSLCYCSWLARRWLAIHIARRWLAIHIDRRWLAIHITRHWLAIHIASQVWQALHLAVTHTIVA